MVKKKISEKQKQSNHIEEYFDGQQGNKSSELFKITEPEQIDFKSDLSLDEIKIITTLEHADAFLEEKNIPPVFEKYYIKYMRLVVSKDRQGRSEFVGMNKKDDIDETLSRLGNVSNIVGSRK